jgi:acetyl esterase/lipase
VSGFTLHGGFRHKLRSVLNLIRATEQVCRRRIVGKSPFPDWPWDIETWVLFTRMQIQHAFSLNAIVEAREYIDSLVFDPLDPFEGEILPAAASTPVRGKWFIPSGAAPDRVTLYFHGGGYAYYTKSQEPLIANIAQAAGTRTFALDYRLAPEHPHPAQLDDALAAYRWLLAAGNPPGRIVLAGDSAGGHLALMTLVALREADLPQPALVIGLCPWTDIGNRGRSLFENDRYDWIQGYQALKFGEWFKGDSGLSDEALSPIYSDYEGLVPIYLQAGGQEILVDMIREFAAIAEQQGAEVTLDIWENMVHDFQGFGGYLRESREALERISSVVKHYLNSEPTEDHFPRCPNTMVQGRATRRAPELEC